MDNPIDQDENFEKLSKREESEQLFINEFEDSINATCLKYGNPVLDYDFKISSFVLDTKHKLAYCRQAKV